MEVYKVENASKPMYYFVYGRGNDEVWAARVSSGSLGKWGFYKWPEEKFAKFYSPRKQYKGKIEKDVMERLLEGIFRVPAKTLKQGSKVWG